MFEQFFTGLGFSKTEAKVFKGLYTLGTKPASTLAKYLGMERTSVYKILQRLVHENLVFETYKGGIKHFFIPNTEILQEYTQHKIEKYEKVQKNYQVIKNELQELGKKKDTNIPKITLFDSAQGIKNMYEDIVSTTIKRQYISIRLFASNTVDSQVSISDEMKSASLDLFQKLATEKVQLETFLGNGIMLMENISKTFDINAIEKLPASNSAVNIYLVGDIIYIIIFKDTPFGIKIESEDLAYTLHFLFDKIEFKS